MLIVWLAEPRFNARDACNIQEQVKTRWKKHSQKLIEQAVACLEIAGGAFSVLARFSRPSSS